VRGVGEQRPQGDDLGHAELLDVPEQLSAEAPPSQVGLDAVHQHDVTVGARQLRDGQPRGLPLDATGDAPGQAYVWAGDLEVVVVLGVDRGQRRRVPRELEVLQRGAGGLTGVVPAFERGDHHRLHERGHGLVGTTVGTGGRIAVGHLTTLRPRAVRGSVGARR
jgi:hypothetical protein